MTLSRFIHIALDILLANLIIAFNPADVAGYDVSGRPCALPANR